MDEFLDMEVVPSDGGDYDDDDTGSNDDTGTKDAPSIVRGDDAPFRGSSPKHRRM